MFTTNQPNMNLLCTISSYREKLDLKVTFRVTCVFSSFVYEIVFVFTYFAIVLKKK